MDYFKISDGKVIMRTGKSWKEWFRILNAWNAKKHGHAETAKYVAKRYHLSPWWSQVVTIRYEKEKGYWKRSG